MLLYLIKFSATTIWVYSAIVVYWVSCSMHSSTFFLDFVNRINLNLCYWDSAYFLWTNLSYIYLLFIPIIILVLLRLLQVNSNYTLELAVIIGLTLSQVILLLLSFNYQTQAFRFNDSSNLLLVNSVNKYHPLMLHISLWFVCVFVVYNTSTIYKLKNQLHSYYNFRLVLNFFILCFITMWLGSWWAYQEGSWGGWWAWDPSEVFGLIILISLISVFHYNFIGGKSVLLRNNVKSAATFVLLIYVLLQSNFSITSHNFGLDEGSDYFFQNKYLAATQLLLVLVSYLLLVNTYRLKLKLLPTFKSYNNVNYYAAQVSLILITSVVPLLTDLLWKSLSLNLGNINVNYWTLLNILVLLILLRVKLINYFVLANYTATVLLFMVNSYSALFLVTLMLSLEFCSFSILHVSIGTLVISSLTSYEYYYSYWLSSTTNTLSLATDSVESFCNAWTYGYPFIIKNSFSSSNALSTPLILSGNSTFETTLFNLKHSQALTSQIFISGEGRLPFTTSVIDNFSSPLLVLLLIIVTIMLAERAKTLLIKC